MKRAILLSMVLFAAFGLSGCSYNDLTAKQQQIKGKWANVESAMQRRADLVPNLVDVAKMTAVQEQEVFGQIADARSRLLNAQQAAPAGADGDKTPEQKQAVIDANNSFGGTIGRLLSLQEQYPALRSSEAFMKVQDELSGTENRLNTARIDFNDAVTAYNTTRNSFPAVLTAGLLGFKEEPFFKAEEGAKTAPKVGDPNSLRKPDAPVAPVAPATK
ncbi:MAG: LemA family protein [Pyrinomonadaceae bacterium]|nr:LemA family protein [Acidobacteriota bacterium]MBK7933937.1 LemA family protein [Acidobacteriota bacterium]MBP7376227.1 LemA family protein [Pyrinomonadaceae bacterium]